MSNGPLEKHRKPLGLVRLAVHTLLVGGSLFGGSVLAAPPWGGESRMDAMPVVDQRPMLRFSPASQPGIGNQQQDVQCPSREELDQRLKPIDAMGTNTMPPPGRAVPNCAIDYFRSDAEPSIDEFRTWSPSTFNWKASGAVHRPLYFEDVPVERYGQTRGKLLQPVISGARFFATIPLLPYKMTMQPPRRCVYALGYYRPGTCAPPMQQHLPWNFKAAVVEAGFITGAILLIP